MDTTMSALRQVREYQPPAPELPDRKPRTLVQLVHDRLASGGGVTLTLGISIPPLDATHRASWSRHDTAALLLALQVDMGAVPEPTFEEIRAAWCSRTN
jgi:hypothetical protein